MAAGCWREDDVANTAVTYIRYMAVLVAMVRAVWEAAAAMVWLMSTHSQMETRSEYDNQPRNCAWARASLGEARRRRRMQLLVI